MHDLTEIFGALSCNLFAMFRELARNKPGLRPLTLSVTSARPREGKTFVAQGLALHAAALGEFRILLVDANFKSPSLADRFSGAEKRGLSDALQEDPATAELLGTPFANMFVVGAGRSPRPALLYREGALRRFIKSAETDVVIFDCGCVSSNRANVVARKADRVLFVVDSLSTPREAVGDAIRRLRDDARETIWGIVLNKKPKYALTSE
jgi:Mrp family chromosome partitioning ATPase